MRPSDVHTGLTKRDWLGAFGVCILVVLSTFPVVIPFIVFKMPDWRYGVPMHSLSYRYLFADIFLHVTLDFGRLQRA